VTLSVYSYGARRCIRKKHGEGLRLCGSPLTVFRLTLNFRRHTARSNTMSAAYKNVLGGSLKLKGKGPAGAPVRRSDAPRPVAPVASSAAPCLSGSKRKADVSADSCTHAPPSKRSDHRLDAPTSASPIETKEPESEAGPGKPSVDSKPASVADRRTAAQKAHDEALAKRVSGRGAAR